jgi:hypothetical protein
MTSITTRFALPAAALAALSLGACATTPPAPSTADLLTSAGFHMKLADTPQKMALLKQLPPHHFIHKEKGDKVLTVWADPAGCKCLYVGNQAAWQAYKQAAFAQHIAYEDQQAAAQVQEAAMLNDDAAMVNNVGWGWGAWGEEPWAP